MNYLTRWEEMLLIAVHRLKGEAYGVPVKKHLTEVTGKIISFGALYVSLDKLVKKGYLSKTKGEPTAERGGRSKIFYQISSEGEKALQATRDLQKNLWDGIPEYEFNKK
ncbi:MAG: PadR family transcriptional regulator [bacterium]|nr:PadR family transcriptional regulator [bacterium]